MREDEMNELISEALRDAPSAPEELRHNVMAAINELEYAPEKPKGNKCRIASALAGIAVIAVAIIAVSPLFSNDSAVNLTSYSSGTGAGNGAVTMDSTEADGGDINYSQQKPGEALPESGTAKDEELENAISGSLDSGAAYTVTGELPEELDGLSYTAYPDESRIYENVPDEIIVLLLANNTHIIETPVDGSGNVVKWIP